MQFLRRVLYRLHVFGICLSWLLVLFFLKGVWRCLRWLIVRWPLGDVLRWLIVRGKWFGAQWQGSTAALQHHLFLSNPVRLKGNSGTAVDLPILLPLDEMVWIQLSFCKRNLKKLRINFYLFYLLSIFCDILKWIYLWVRS